MSPTTVEASASTVAATVGADRCVCPDFRRKFIIFVKIIIEEKGKIICQKQILQQFNFIIYYIKNKI
jgi:hypothetical protein